MNLLNGRPRKYENEQEKAIALGYLEAKLREPWLTQDEYACNYRISTRTLRRYIKEHGELAAIRIQIQRLESKKESLLRDSIEKENITEQENRGKMIVVWT